MKNGETRLINSFEFDRHMKEYEQCIRELRAYKSHVVALQEDLEEVEKENNTLRLITEKSEQSRRMSILITENEALFQSNCKLCDQLEDLETDIEEKEEGVNLDFEKTRLTRSVENLYKQNTKLEKELRQLKETDSEQLENRRNMECEKERLDEKIHEMADIISESDKKCKNLENEKQDLETEKDELIKKINQNNDEMDKKDSELQKMCVQLSGLDQIQAELLEANMLRSQLQRELQNGNGHTNICESNANHRSEGSDSDLSTENGGDHIDSPGIGVLGSNIYGSMNSAHIENGNEKILDEIKMAKDKNEELKTTIKNLRGIIQTALSHLYPSLDLHCVPEQEERFEEYVKTFTNN